VYKRLPLFDSLVAARHYRQMYLDYCSLLEKAGLSLPAHDTRIVAVPGRPTALYIAQKKLPDANFFHKLIHHLDDGSSLDLIERAIREIVKIWIVFLGLRRLDRFFTTRLLWKRYEFILPGKIKR
jgi:hypothetical protein